MSRHLTLRLAWLWAAIAFHIYLRLPLASDLRSPYGRLELWLLGYAGTYAYIDDFSEFVEWKIRPLASLAEW